MPLTLEQRWLSKHPRKTQADVTAARMEGMEIVEFHGDVIMICAEDAKFLSFPAKKRELPRNRRALIIPEVGWIEIPPRQAVKTVVRRYERKARYPMNEGVPPHGHEVYMVTADGKIVRV